jgi:hypothetical protein
MSVRLHKANTDTGVIRPGIPGQRGTTTSVPEHLSGRSGPGTTRTPVGSGQILTTRTGLRISTDVTFDGWQQAGQQISGVVDSAAWCLGDWLVYGQHRYADRYRVAVAAANLDYQTLRNYAWVARRFEHARRRETLSFQHHAEVAALPEAVQDMLLDKAERLSWSRSMLRRQVREVRSGAAADEPGAPVVKRLTIAAHRVERWRLAAEQAEADLNEWMVEVLDSAAARAIGTDADPAAGAPGDPTDVRPETATRPDAAAADRRG